MSMPYSAMPSPRATKIMLLPKVLGSSVRAPMAAQAEFATERATVELLGLCARCREEGHR